MADCQFNHVQWFRTFVEDSRWQFAKTYVKSYPHEYTVVRWGAPEAFATAVDCIERFGVPEVFWGTTRKYLYVDDRKYWHMADLSAKSDAIPTLINRAWVDVSNYRSNAQTLGYNEEQLDRLAARWVVLMEHAKNGG